MKAEPRVPRSLVETAVDGGTIDWDGIESGADADSRRLLENLRFVAALSARHRGETEPDSDDGAGRPATVVRFPAAPPDSWGGHRGHGRWGHFELLERVGTGSFGDVYRARDTKLVREVAIKLFKPEAARNRSIRERVLGEGRALAKIHHPNVVTVFSVEEHDGRAGLCMEYIRGRTLEDLLQEQGPMSPPEAAHIGQELCRALSAVHGAGLLHRDVKTGNVMRAEGGRIVLMDFGAWTLADLEASARLTGTPLYLAPEVLNGERPTAQSDLYALGVLLYRLVTTQYPLEAASVPELRERHAHREWADVAPGLARFPDAFATLLRRALSPAPADRPRHAEAFLSALQRLQARRPLWPVAVVAVGVVSAGLLVFDFAQRLQSPPPGPSVADAAVTGPRVAILGLRNLTDVPDWRVAILEEDLRSALAKVPGLALIGRASVDNVLAGFGADPDVFQRELGARWVLEGAVRTGPPAAPDDLRVTLRLLRAGVQTWEGSFTSFASATSTVPSDVIALITTGLGLDLSPSRQGAVSPHSPSPEARQLYGEARALQQTISVPAFTRARELLDRALAIDPTYALAHAALARSLLELEIFGVVPTPDAYRGALAAASRALTLDDGLADSHLTLADLKLNFEWDWDAAGGAFARAIEIDPNHIQARINYSKYLAALGRLDEALAQAEVARSLDRLSDATGNMGLMLYYARRYDDALAIYRARLEATPGLPQVPFTAARILSAAGRFDEALAHLDTAINLSGGVSGNSYRVAEKARTLAQAGREQEAREWLSRLDPVSPATSPTMLAYHGYVHAALGDRERALALFEEAVNRRALVLLWAQVDPRLDPVRDDARFRANVLARLGLAR